MHSSDPDFPIMAADHFLETMGNDPVLCLSILETARREANDQVALIQKLSGSADRESVRAVLHSLRGGSSTFEASALCEVLQKMETACEIDEIGSALSLLGDFQTEARRYREALDCLMEEMRLLT